MDVLKDIATIQAPTIKVPDAPTPGKSFVGHSGVNETTLGHPKPFFYMVLGYSGELWTIMAYYGLYSRSTAHGGLGPYIYTRQFLYSAENVCSASKAPLKQHKFL